MSAVDMFAWSGVALISTAFVAMNLLGWRMLRENRKLREHYGLPPRR